DCIVRQEQCLVGLLGIGLLGVLANINLAVEYAPRLAIEDPLVELMAGTARFGVIDDRMVVDELAVRREIEAVEGTLAILIAKHGVGFIADDQAAQRDGMRGDIAALLQVNL